MFLCTKKPDSATGLYWFQLEDIGLELLFILDGFLAKDMVTIIQSAGNHQIEAIRHRAGVSRVPSPHFSTPNITCCYPVIYDKIYDVGVGRLVDSTLDF